MSFCANMSFWAPRGAVLPLLFCSFLAPACAQASADQVFPGCAVPGPPKHRFYFDAANGSDAGDGSKAHPWKSVQAVFAPERGASPLLSTVPYRHLAPDGKTVVVAPNPDAPIKPGDAIELMSGDYGKLFAFIYATPIINSDFVTIEAAPGQTPVIEQLFVGGTNKWRFRGLKVQGLKDRRPQVSVGNGASPTEDIILDGLSISTQDDISAWSKEDWRTSGRQGVGVRIGGPGGAGPGGCVAIVNSKIFNVTFGIGLEGNRILVDNNTINNFGDDGIDYGVNDLIISHNTITNSNEIGDGEHIDAMQGQSSGRPPGIRSNHFHNILIDSNLVIRQTDPHLKFPAGMQGIDAFDEDWDDITVSNNVVITTACWGIAYASVHGGKFINNTVLADNLLPAVVARAGNCKPGVGVADKTHEGSSSNDVIIRNNLGNGLGIYNLDPNMTMDHNICVATDGKCPVLFYVDGKPAWGHSKPGVYGDHNLVDGRGAEGEFVKFDPANLVYDVRLKAGARAIGAGNPAEAPARDITGAERQGPADVGAYRYDPQTGSAK